MAGLKDEKLPETLEIGKSEERAQPIAKDLLCVTEVRVLIIDDDPPTCHVIEAALAHEDFQILAISDLAKVESALKSATKYHLIILDFVLPGLNTEQVLTWVRDHQPEAALIVVTGHPTVQNAVTSLRARAYEYLTKPFQIAQLRETVLRCLQNRGLMRMSGEALREAVGASIRERRKVLNLTLDEIARRTGLSLGYLSQLELGRASPSIETLYKLSLTLGVRIGDFFQNIQSG
jgi:DNA-binding response OmpR family regulator